MNSLHEIYKGRKVFLTGHTGFKGSWLALWLEALGAQVTGYALPAETTPNNFELAKVAQGIRHCEGDLRDYAQLTAVMQETQPDIVFHLAAQALVLPSYESPKETFDINVGGTVNVLEAIRHCASVQAAVMITTDKVYENQEWAWGYRENDRLGGHDPYSASKSMTELACHAYRHSFFSGNRELPLATARAGNVIGGGDFSPLRIVPDCMQALIENRPIPVRNPHSIRPWLHVLEPLYGYLILGQNLLEKGMSFSGSWNFGPLEHEGITVRQLVEKAISCWPSGSWKDISQPGQKKEMHTLKLNWDKAAAYLGWHPRLTWEDAVQTTAEWFLAYQNQKEMRQTCLEQIEAYQMLATARNGVSLSL